MLISSMIFVLFLFCLLGMEIAWAIGLACFGYLFFAQFGDAPIPFVLVSQQMTVGVDAFVLLAIPLFIFAGELMNEAGVTQRIVRFAAAFVGHRQGGLANVGVTQLHHVWHVWLLSRGRCCYRNSFDSRNAQKRIFSSFFKRCNCFRGYRRSDRSPLNFFHSSWCNRKPLSRKIISSRGNTWDNYVYSDVHSYMVAM